MPIFTKTETRIIDGEEWKREINVISCRICGKIITKKSKEQFKKFLEESQFKKKFEESQFNILKTYDDDIEFICNHCKSYLYKWYNEYKKRSNNVVNISKFLHLLMQITLNDILDDYPEILNSKDRWLEAYQYVVNYIEKNFQKYIKKLVNTIEND